jgi:hypothetical protein
MKRIFVSQIFPQEFIGKFQVSQAGNNFCYRLISYNAFTDVFSICPINVRERLTSHGFAFHFVQRRLVPHVGILRAFNVFLENMEVFRAIFATSRRQDSVWFYNITVSNFILFIFLKLVRRNVYVIVADHEPKFPVLSFAFASHLLLKIADGIISLSDSLRGSFSKNLEVLCGVIDEALPMRKINGALVVNKGIFLYAGALEDYCGISLALNAFKECPKAQLVITGRGSCSEKVLDFCRKYPNIHYLGFMDYQKYLDVMSSVTFCLSLRDPSVPFNQFNFPSKIIEFCQFGKVVITTMEYSSFPCRSLLRSNFEVADLVNVVYKCLGMDRRAIGIRGRDAQISILMNFGKERWLRVISSVEDSGTK